MTNQRSEERSRQTFSFYKAKQRYRWMMSSEMSKTGDHGPVTVEGSNLLRNDPGKKWVVQKFGGTSVGKFPDSIVEDVVKYVC